MRITLTNVTVQRRRRPRIVLLVGARQTAAIRLRRCRAIIVNYVIVIVIDLRLGGRLEAFAFVNVALVFMHGGGLNFMMHK